MDPELSALTTKHSHICRGSTRRNHVYSVLPTGYRPVCWVVLCIPRDQGEREKLRQQSQAARKDCDRNW